ncbi:MAG: glutamate synthase subunit beta [Planctomycetota bacterium]
MGKPTGFLEYERIAMPARRPDVRLGDWYEIYERADTHVLQEQGARCMDCGVAFCQSDTGCPIDNLIPEWNDLVYHNRWREAYERLSKTNNFPEFTGRICPAPCESACVLGITDPPVTIKSLECAIIDRAFEEGWVVPREPALRTGKTVAVVGSGPAGLAAADQLNQAGHTVTVFERDDRIGGLLMYGVPNMKLDKGLVQRRVDLLAAEGVVFRTNCNVGGEASDQGTATPADGAETIDPQTLVDDFDAVLLACGALKARMLDLPGAELDGVHRAMAYLHQSTRSLLDSEFADGKFIDAKDKDVVVIGGGDTGTDCIGTALRQGCRSVVNITRRQREPDYRDEQHPWPGPPGTFYVDYGHAEGQAKFGKDPREFRVLPKAFVPSEDDPTKLGAVRIAMLDWKQDPETGRMTSTEIEGSEKDVPADLCFLSIGFTGADTPELLKNMGIASERGVVPSAYGDFATGVDNVFVAGDMRRGASLIVWAIAEGRGAARRIDAHLMGASSLPAPIEDAAMLSSAD